MANLFGTNGNDIINGSINNDNIFAFDGNDIINSSDGDDYIDGGNGNDTLNGGNGNDTLDGGNGDDNLNGGNGNDILIGGNGNDFLDGGIGNDILIGGDGNDTLRANIGNDTLNGGVGNDTADYSQLGQSITLSPVGVVTKAGGFGTDQLVQIETIIANAAVANNTIDASTAAGASITVNLQTQSLTVNGVPGVGPFTVINFDNVRGTNLNDTITGDSQSNQLFGNGGNDLFRGSAGNDIVNGGVGSDTADYSQLGQSITLSPVGVVTKAGGFGTDQLVQIETIIANAAVANNTIDASTAAGASITVNLQTQSLTVNGVPGVGPFTVINFDNVRGTNLNDTITGDSQSNQLFGNGGNDLFRGSAGNDTLNGGVGSDTADYSQLNARITLLPTGVLNKGIFGTDQLVQIETIIANAAVANNTIDASTAAGASIIANLQTQSLTVNGVPGVGPFTVINFDDVRGTNLNDTITGDSQSNQLFGNGGNDLFRGSAGNDIVNGGVGSDTADYSQLGQSITLAPTGVITKAGGFGTDQLVQIETIIANAAVANNTIDASTAAGASISVSLQAQSLLVNGVPGVGPFTVINFDDVRGTNLNDTITGDSQSNQLFGNGGNDFLSGDSGNDTLNGGTGNDFLVGGFGNDTLTGGVGADRFVFNSLFEGLDIIKDFQWIEGDKIQISQVGFGAFSLSQFNYNNMTGALSFQSTQFATIENKPAGFAVTLDVVLV